MAITTLYDSDISINNAYRYILSNKNDSTITKFALAKNNEAFIISMNIVHSRLHQICAYTFIKDNDKIIKKDIAIADILITDSNELHLSFIGMLYEKDKREGIGSMLLSFIEEQAYKNDKKFISLVPITHALPFYIENSYTKHINKKNKVVFGKMVRDCYITSNGNRPNKAYTTLCTDIRARLKVERINNNLDRIITKVKTKVVNDELDA